MGNRQTTTETATANATSKSNKFSKQKKTLHVHHAFLYISLPSLHNYDVKGPISSFFEDGNGKAIKSTISG